MKVKAEVKLGLVALLAIALLVWGVNFLKGKNILKDQVHFYAVYDDVDGMDVSSPVRINGFTVGKVTEVGFHTDLSGRIVVKFELDKEFAIPRNTVARIYNADLMGTKALQLSLGKSAIIAASGDTLSSDVEDDLKDEVNKQVLPLKNKAEDLISSIDSVMTVITTVLDKDARASLTNSLLSLNRTFSTMELAMVKLDSMIYKNDHRVGTILSNVESITTNLHNNNVAISKVIQNVESLTDSLAKSEVKSTMKNLNSSLAQFDAVLEKVNKGEGSLGLLINDKKLYNNLADASNQLDQLIEDMKKNPRRYVSFSLLGGRKTSFEFKTDSTKAN
jgi:phospholipid/cholesterol/gamma-HCH transport system substrate-binding protein